MPAKAFNAADVLNQESSPDLDETSDVSTDSSTDDGANQPSLLDVVKDAVEPESPPDEMVDEDQDQEDSDDETEDEAEEETDESDVESDDEADEDADESPKETEAEMLARLEKDLRAEGKNLQKIARFREIHGENKELKSKLEQYDFELERTKPVRDHLDQIAEAAKRVGMEPQTVADIMALPMLYASDPAAALQKLSAIQQAWSGEVGETLPSDIQQAVEDGHLTEEYAKQLARERAKAQRAERDSEYTKQQTAEERRQSTLSEARNALNTYQASLVQSDPDYTDTARKLHQDRLIAICQQRGLPQDKDTAVSMAQEAWDSVKKDMQALLPKPTKKRTVQGRRSNKSPAAAPSSMLEAISGVVGGVSEDE